MESHFVNFFKFFKLHQYFIRNTHSRHDTKREKIKMANRSTIATVCHA